MKYLGQHFLRDINILRQIANSLKIESGDVIVEIGAGHGELTLEIKNQISHAYRQAGKIKNNTIKIVAIEKDKELVHVLQKKFASDKNIKIIEDDVLKILPKLVDSILRTSDVLRLKIVGNIPYYITGYLLRILGELENKPSLIVLTIQKEVAERICAEPLRRRQGFGGQAKMNLLAASVQFWAKPEIIGFINRKSFNPPPEVDGAIIKLKVKSEKLKVMSENYYKLIKVLFKQPRKTILNNLSAGLKISKEEIIKILAEQSIEPGARPQNLTIHDLIVLSNVFQSKK